MTWPPWSKATVLNNARTLRILAGQLQGLDRKRLAVKLRIHGEEITRAADVLICAEQDELIGEAAATLFDAAATTWPGDEMPRLDDNRQGERDGDENAEQGALAGSRLSSVVSPAASAVELRIRVRWTVLSCNNR